MREMFRRSGEVGRHLSEVDWAATPLGDPSTWPGSLQTVVRMLLTSRFSMWMAWGPELTFFCNDAYRRDTLGTKYPWALGRRADEVWAEIWPDAGPRIEHVLTTGEATWDSNLQLFLKRSGYVEETYHTFSYSPLADDSGQVVGMLCVVAENTLEVIAQRRMSVLRDLGVGTDSSLSEASALTRLGDQLAAYPEDLPFTLVYLFDADGSQAQLVLSTGFKGSHAIAPATIDVADESAPWQAARARQGRDAVIEGLGSRYADLPTGCWTEPPDTAVVVPLVGVSQAEPTGFLVAGTNRYRPLDDGYRDFLRLAGGQISSAIANARTFEAERARAAELARLDQAKTDFFTNISHEFRTPLTLLLGPAEDALSDAQDPLSEGQKERLETIVRNGQRMLTLVNTLLDFSRLESGRLEATFEPTDLAAYTRELAALFDAASERLGLHLEVDCPPLPEPVFVDRDLWAKVVLNLLSNAVKFTFDGTITVQVRPVDDGAELSVTDTGTGIPQHELPRLFERFHRVHGADGRSHEGSGIGLALVAELARLHGGSVAADSALGAGSTFSVRVPYGSAHLPPAQVRQDPSPTVPLPPPLDTLLPPERPSSVADVLPGPDDRAAVVLLVDDNPDIRDYVATLLSEEYRVVTATDGVEALERARELVPDLIMTDVMMPRMDGFELLAALQQDPLTVGIPVVMLSARAGESGLIQGLDAGADDYLVKPFTSRELRARVRANLELDRSRRVRRQLERSRSMLNQAQRMAQVGSWEIDLASGTLDTSEEFARIVGLRVDELASLRYPELVGALFHPEDRALVTAAFEDCLDGRPLALEVRLLQPKGAPIPVSLHGELLHGPDGAPDSLRGSLQDVSDRKKAEEALAIAAANAEAAAREHAIADELQHSLLPRLTFDPRNLDVATYYRAGVEGTQVGGDWYDVIELASGRTALVVGDVMGRGVQAAAVMGQLRAATRAYARLELPPAQVIEFLDGMVRELGTNQIVTCLYAVFDPADRVLRIANAGHMPPIVRVPDGEPEILWGAGSPPLGAGPHKVVQREVPLAAGTWIVVYTDGLVERRRRDIETGVHALADEVATVQGPAAGVPEHLVEALLPDGPDDDVALLVARVDVPHTEADPTDLG